MWHNKNEQQTQTSIARPMSKMKTKHKRKILILKCCTNIHKASSNKTELHNVPKIIEEQQLNTKHVKLIMQKRLFSFFRCQSPTAMKQRLSTRGKYYCKPITQDRVEVYQWKIITPWTNSFSQWIYLLCLFYLN